MHCTWHSTGPYSRRRRSHCRQTTSHRSPHSCFQSCARVAEPSTLVAIRVKLGTTRATLVSRRASCSCWPASAAVPRRSMAGMKFRGVADRTAIESAKFRFLPVSIPSTVPRQSRPLSRLTRNLTSLAFWKRDARRAARVVRLYAVSAACLSPVNMVLHVSSTALRCIALRHQMDRRRNTARVVDLPHTHTHTPQRARGPVRSSNSFSHTSKLAANAVLVQM